MSMNNLTSKDITLAIKIAWDGVDDSVVGPMMKPCTKDNVLLSAKAFEYLKKEGKHNDILFRIDGTAFQVFLDSFRSICPRSLVQGNFNVKDRAEGDDWKNQE